MERHFFLMDTIGIDIWYNIAIFVVKPVHLKVTCLACRAIRHAMRTHKGIHFGGLRLSIPRVRKWFRIWHRARMRMNSWRRVRKGEDTEILIV